MALVDPAKCCIFLALWVCDLPGVFTWFSSFSPRQPPPQGSHQQAPQAQMAHHPQGPAPFGMGGGFLSELLTRPNTDLILTMNTPVSNIISTFATMTFSDRTEHVTAMASAMQAAATASQAPVMALLNAFGVQTESYWLTNQIYVKGANPPLVQALMALSAVKSIAEERKFPLIPIFNQTTGTVPNGTLWNVKKIGARKLWKQGIKGQGILVAGIDTGVRGTHTTLRDNYVGTENFGWLDPIWNTKEPNDMQGHGTHTVGTMVGKNGIGAAPKAKWMACKGCGIQSCMQHALLACGQFILCPSDPKGKRLNCTNVPHIVNNSWGGPGGQTWYDDVIAAWKAAGIIAFFANGNNGPGCETAGSPGDHEYVIAVGATDVDDKLAKFSSRGPRVTMVNMMGNENDGGFFGQLMGMIGKKKLATDCIKPEISAPGHEINSAGVMTDNSYKVQSGTSMATPLVAGAAALLMSKNPKLTMEEMKHLMYTTADQKLPPIETEQCGPIPETEFPNNMYGHGRLNIYKAYKKMLQLMKQRKKEEKEEKEEELRRMIEEDEKDLEDGEDDNDEDWLERVDEIHTEPQLLRSPVKSDNTQMPTQPTKKKKREVREEDDELDRISREK